MNFEELQETLNAINMIKYKYNVSEEDLGELYKAINKAIFRLMNSNENNEWIGKIYMKNSKTLKSVLMSSVVKNCIERWNHIYWIFWLL